MASKYKSYDITYVSHLHMRSFTLCFTVMDVQAFERLLGPCMDIMKRNIANYEEQLITLFGSHMAIEEQNA